MTVLPIKSPETGQKIPAWELRHRLPVGRAVGPEIQDCGTIYRINHSFMDVTAYDFMSRQVVAQTVFLFAPLVLLSVAIAVLCWAGEFPGPPLYVGLGAIAALLFGAVFAHFTFLMFRDEFFALRQKPIRFHRGHQKLYAVRRRRFFAKPGQGDIVVDIPWNDDAVFCLHRTVHDTGTKFFIKAYILDDQDKVAYAFLLGRAWDGSHSLPALLAQWNYWCEYMNHGTANLPPPDMYFQEHETAAESWRIAFYHLCRDAWLIVRLLYLPLVAISGFVRLLIMWTGRAPVWPEEIRQASEIKPSAANHPASGTPVGWGDTMAARKYDDAPRDNKRVLAGWQGESDPLRNALLWLENSAPAFVSRWKAKKGYTSAE